MTNGHSLSLASGLRVRRRVPPLLPPSSASNTVQTHQEVLLAVHFLTHVIEGLPAEPSPWRGREEGVIEADTRDRVWLEQQYSPPTNEKMNIGHLQTPLHLL